MAVSDVTKRLHQIFQPLAWKLMMLNL